MRNETLAGESWADVGDRLRRQSRAALDRARRSDDPKALAVALANQRWNVLGSSHLRQRLRLSTELVDTAALIGDIELLQQGRLFRISDLLERGRLAAADTIIADHARDCDRHPQTHSLWVCAYLRAMRAQLDGRLDLAESLASEALHIGATEFPQVAQMVFALQLFTIRSAQGRLLELADLVEMIIGAAPDRVSAQVTLIAIRCLQGRKEEAQVGLDAIAADGFAAIHADTATWLDSLAGLVRPIAHLGDRQRAEVVYDYLLPLADIHLIGGVSMTYVAVVSGFLGILAATLERWSEAAEHFEFAIDRNQRMGAQAVVAHTRFEYARALLAEAGAGRSRAIALLRDVGDAAHRLVLPGLVTDLQALTSAHGL